MPCGWRGPYLRLALGQTSIRDGWGNPLILFSDLAGTPAAVGDPILAVSSTAAQRQQPLQCAAGSQYRTGPDRRQRKRLRCWIPMETPPTRPGAVQVWMYGPNPSTGGLWESQCTTTTATDGVVSYSIPAGVYAPVSCVPISAAVEPRRREEPHRAVSTKRCHQP